MSERGFTAIFGASKASLATVQRAFLNSAKAVIGAWGGTVLELPIGSGIYGAHEEAPAGANWIAWRTGDAPERFLVASLADRAFVFNGGPGNSGKSIGYTFLDSAGAAVGAEITAGVTEFQAGTGIYLALNTAVPATAVWVRARTIEASPKYLVMSLEPADETAPAVAGHSDDLDYNLQFSLEGFFKNHADLTGLTVKLRERELSIPVLPPNLFINKPRRKAHAWTTGSAEFREEFDDAALTVDTFGLEIWEVEVQCDLGCRNDSDRQKWARKIDVALRTAEREGGIPCLDYSGEGESPTTQVGTIFVRYTSGEVVHNFVDETPADRIFQDSIVLSFRYEHEYVIAQDEDQLTTFEVNLEVA